MKVTRIYADAEGVTHFEDQEIDLKDAGEIGRLSDKIPATGVIFRETDPAYDYDWHPVPQRQFILMLEGELDVEVGDGEIRHFSGGDVMLFEDTEGQGHRSRTTDGKVRRTVFVTLD